MNAVQLRRKSHKELLALAEGAGLSCAFATKAEIIEALLGAGVPPSTDAKGQEDLPSSYGRTRFVIMEVEPRLIHAYWEITPRDFQAATAQLGPPDGPAPWVMRFYDVTYVVFDGTNAHGYFDVPIDLVPGNWYVKLWEGEKAYFAEIGPRTTDGRFIKVIRSNFVHVPRGEPSPRYDPHWLKVQAESGRQEPVRKSVSEPASREDDAGPAPLDSNQPQGGCEAEFRPEQTLFPSTPNLTETASTPPDQRTAQTAETDAGFYMQGSSESVFPTERTTAVDCQAMVLGTHSRVVKADD